MLVMFYYMSTTMSTVGLGDFHPKNSQERVVITAYLLIGILFFSYILNETNKMTDKLSNSMQSFHDINGLNQFLEMISRLFNDGQHDTEVYDQITQFFEFYWQNSRLQFM